MLHLFIALIVMPPDLTLTCTAEEYAYYEAQGWDAYECDGDKAAEAERKAEDEQPNP